MSSMSKHKPTLKKNQPNWNVITSLSAYGPEPGSQNLLSDLSPSRRTRLPEPGLCYLSY